MKQLAKCLLRFGFLPARLELAVQSRGNLVMSRFVGQVVELSRIAFVIVEFSASVMPFGVAPLLGANGSSELAGVERLAGIAAAAHHAERPLFPRSIGLAQERHKTLAFESSDRRQLAQLDQRGIEINQFRVFWAYFQLYHLIE